MLRSDKRFWIMFRHDAILRQYQNFVTKPRGRQKFLKTGFQIKNVWNKNWFSIWEIPITLCAHCRICTRKNHASNCRNDTLLHRWIGSQMHFKSKPVKCIPSVKKEMKIWLPVPHIAISFKKKKLPTVLSPSSFPLFVDTRWLIGKIPESVPEVM